MIAETNAIQAEKPDVVFAPHVETSAGMILPDDYVRSLADAVHQHGGLMVLDCIASGTLWVDMAETGVDVLISAPQKGWSGSPCAGLVMLSARAEAILQETTSTSFSCDLKKWREIMSAYESGGHAYHATMPTDGLRAFVEAWGGYIPEIHGISVALRAMRDTDKEAAAAWEDRRNRTHRCLLPHPRVYAGQIQRVEGQRTGQSDLLGS